MFLRPAAVDRHEAFDAFIADTTAALTQMRPEQLEPAVYARREALLAKVATAFLPNVRDGIATIPDSQKDTDHVAVIPVTRKERVALTSDLWLPSRQQWQRTGATEQLADKITQRISNADQQPIVQHVGEDQEMRLTAQPMSATLQSGTLQTMGRGMLLLNTRDMSRIPAVRGASGAHELYHDDTFNYQQTAVPTDSHELLRYKAELERPAYHLTVGILGEAGMHAYRKEDVVRTAAKVEALHRPGASFAADDATVHAMQRLHVI